MKHFNVVVHNFNMKLIQEHIDKMDEIIQRGLVRITNTDMSVDESADLAFAELMEQNKVDLDNYVDVEYEAHIQKNKGKKIISYNTENFYPIFEE